jgi:hypothetical protein
VAKHVEHTGSQAVHAPSEANCPAGHVVKVELAEPFGRKGIGSQASGFDEETWRPVSQAVQAVDEQDVQPARQAVEVSGQLTGASTPKS